MPINWGTGGTQSHPGFTPITKQTYSFYSSNNTTVTVNWSNVPNDCSAILVTYYTGTDNDHIDWHMGRSVNSSASWNSGSTDPGWSDAWGDVLQTWVAGNVGGYSWWNGSSVIPVTSNGEFQINNAGCSGQGNRLRMALIGYFGGDN